MPAVLTSASFSAVPAGRAETLRVPAARSPGDDAPVLGGLARLVAVVHQGLTASWAPFCPDLLNEVARGAGRRD